MNGHMTIGDLSARTGVPVKALREYTDLGLIYTLGRSPAGYRLYTDEDLTRLQHVVVYRRLGFGLEEIADLLEREGLNFGMRYEEAGDGVRITDWGTAPSRAAANAPDDDDDQE